ISLASTFALSAEEISRNLISFLLLSADVTGVCLLFVNARGFMEEQLANKTMKTKRKNFPNIPDLFFRISTETPALSGIGKCIIVFLTRKLKTVFICENCLDS